MSSPVSSPNKLVNSPSLTLSQKTPPSKSRFQLEEVREESRVLNPPKGSIGEKVLACTLLLGKKKPMNHHVALLLLGE